MMFGVGVGAALPTRGRTPAPRPTFFQYCYNPKNTSVFKILEYPIDDVNSRSDRPKLSGIKGSLLEKDSSSHPFKKL